MSTRLSNPAGDTTGGGAGGVEGGGLGQRSNKRAEEGSALDKLSSFPPLPRTNQTPRAPSLLQTPSRVP